MIIIITKYSTSSGFPGDVIRIMNALGIVLSHGPSIGIIANTAINTLIISGNGIFMIRIPI